MSFKFSIFSFLKKNYFSLSKKEKILFFYFSILGFLLILKSLFFNEISLLMYYCYFSVFLYAFGVFFRKKNFLGFVFICGFAQLFWIVDILGYVFFNKFIWNFSSHLFEYTPLSFFISVISHFSFLIAYLFMDFHLGKKSLIYSYIYTSLFYFIIMIFFPFGNYRINLIFNELNNKGPLDFLPYRTELYLVYSIFVILIFYIGSFILIFLKRFVEKRIKLLHFKRSK